MKTTPMQGQLVWVWNHRERKPVQLRFVSRNRSWWKWQRPDGTTFNTNGGYLWYESAVNCAWEGFVSEVFSANVREKHLGHKRERIAEDVFSAAAEYVRLFADQFKKPCSEVWAETKGGAS